MSSHVNVALIGLMSELCGAALLALLFLMLRRQARRGRYLLAWTAAWLFLLVSLAATALRFALFPIVGPPGAGAAEPLGVQILTLLALWSRFSYALLLLSGASAFVRGSKLTRCFSLGLPAAGIYALLALLFGEGIERMVFFQGPLLAALHGATAALLARRLVSKRSFGVSLAVVSLAVHAALSAFFSLAYLLGGAPGEERQALFVVLASYGSFFDLLLEVLLGLGMVLIVSEEARRELDAAYAQLEIAYDQLQRESNVDRLTGCFNRRAFEERVGLEGLEQVFGSIAIVDLDNLKQINDERGHEAGDQLLRHLVQVLRKHLRPADRIFRLGGDEFAIVLERARVDEAQARVAAIFKEAPKLLLEGTWPGIAELALEVSLGTAEFESLAGLSHALRRADRRMYDDKRQRKGLDGATTPREGIATVRGEPEARLEPPPEES